MTARGRVGPAGLVLVLATAGLSALIAPPAASAPTLQWAACSSQQLVDLGFECARLSVPVDRDDPSAGEFSLALARHPSTGTADQRIGSLLFNPGGPGGSGLQSASIWMGLPDEVKARFDLVAWDPRGVGDSTPALTGCEMPWPLRPATGPVDWASVLADTRADLARANRECQRLNPGIIGQLGTVESAADLDAIRAALGEERLTYWGMSYGTRIGYVYAVQYPERVRAMVLDGSIDPAATTLSLVQGGAGPDQAYGVFAEAYPLADRQLRQVLAALDQRTVALPLGQTLTRWTVLDSFYGNVMHEWAYPALADAAARLYTTVFGTGADQLSAAQTTAEIAVERGVEPNESEGGVFSAVNCVDYAGRPTPERALAAVTYQNRLAPVYGGSLAAAYAVGCAGLSVTPDPVPVITGRGPDVPVLILGASRDGATIVQWTARMSRAFPVSRTVTYSGAQHVTWVNARSACVNVIADRYVIDLVLPPMDQGCASALTPS